MGKQKKELWPYEAVKKIQLTIFQKFYQFLRHHQRHASGSDKEAENYKYWLISSIRKIENSTKEMKEQTSVSSSATQEEIAELKDSAAEDNGTQDIHQLISNLGSLLKNRGKSNQDEIEAQKQKILNQLRQIEDNNDHERVLRILRNRDSKLVSLEDDIQEEQNTSIEESEYAIPPTIMQLRSKLTQRKSMTTRQNSLLNKREISLRQELMQQHEQEVISLKNRLAEAKKAELELIDKDQELCKSIQKIEEYKDEIDNLNQQLERQRDGIEKLNENHASVKLSFEQAIQELAILFDVKIIT